MDYCHMSCLEQKWFPLTQNLQVLERIQSAQSFRADDTNVVTG